MANVKTLFYGTKKSGTQNNYLEVLLNGDEIKLTIENDIPPIKSVSLDRNTAIKVVKELKRNIGTLNNLTDER